MAYSSVPVTYPPNRRLISRARHCYGNQSGFPVIVPLITQVFVCSLINTFRA